VYFPQCIDEDSIRDLMMRKEAKKMAAMHASAASQYTGHSAMPLNAFNLDIRSHRSDSDIIETPTKAEF